MTINLASRVKAVGRNAVAPLDSGRYIDLNMHLGEYFELNGISARVLELLREPCTVSAICDDIVSGYKVERPRCEADMLSFVQRLVEQGIAEELP